MSDAMERYCSNCAYYDRGVGCQTPSYEACINYSMHKFPEEINQTVAAINKLEKTLSLRKDQEKFSLDKLIDDHWKYVEDMLRVHGTEEEAIDIVGFHYKTSGKHFWKHCCEHYGIEGEE